MTTVAADVHHRGHRLPLASPTCLGAPPPTPMPLCRLMRRQTLRSVIIAIVFNLGSRSPPMSIRRHQAVPEQAEPLFPIALSPAIFPPSPMFICML